MASYADYLEGRGYRRILVQRTQKKPGDLVLAGSTGAVTRVEGAAEKVVRISRKRVR